MSDPDPSPDSSAAGTQAADWYARLRGANLSEVDAARFRAWLASHPSHRREFEEIDLLWDDLGALAQSPEVLRELRREVTGAAGESAGAGRGAAGRPAQLRGHIVPSLSVGRRAWPSTAVFSRVAALSVLLAIGAAFLYLHSSNRYVTGVGEQHVIPLEDGSVVTLNTSSEVRLRYTDARRDVELISGQASFEVAKDPRRPFVVRAGGGEVRAVGTVFDVYKEQRKVTVTLIQGKVAVIPEVAGGVAEPSSLRRLLQTKGPQVERGAPPIESSHKGGSPYAAASARYSVAAARLDGAPAIRGREILLTAGQQLSYGAGTLIAKRADLRRVMAWRERRLDFDDTPLSEAIAEANRYSEVKIELRAPSLAGARISGVFDAGRSELFVEGLQLYFGLHVEYPTRDLIVLTMPE